MKSKIKNENIVRTQAYIDGKWVEGPKRKVFAVHHPFDGKKIGTIPDLGEKEIKQAIEAAYWAFPVWSGLLARERAQMLRRLAELIQQNAQDLAYLLTLEQGKPLQEAHSEVLDTVDTVNWFAEEAGRIHGWTQCDPDKTRSVMTIRQPLGVVGIITPWNFPFYIPAERGFAAVAAGCTVVIKPSEETPLCALALAYLSQEAGIPPGVFNVVTCQHPEEVGKILTTHPLVSKLSFTGSTEVGKKLMASCASTVKRTTLELGGNCPAIVFEDADIEKALQGIFDLKFFNAGQCCNTINRILVHRSIYDAFITRFTEMAKALTVGSGFDSVNIGPLINAQAKQKVDDLVADAASKGAEVIMTKKKQKGLVSPPIIIKNGRSDMRIYSEEIFGPVAAFYSFETEDEAVAMANDTRHGLAAFFYTENLSRSLRVANELEAGSVGINTTNIYSTTLPFGGWKESGIGREGGLESMLNDYCEVKSLSIGK
jgi:succinate-semialdehyde dehydrogenase/glutarate-semialdehyde dehydrogenase